MSVFSWKSSTFAPMLLHRIVFSLWMLLVMALSADGATKRFTLVIDAGHGGHDAGAVGKISKEKTLTLRYALAFGRMIEQNCPDVRVIYTRKTDRFLELWQRAEIANKAKADLFISVHINSLPKGHVARGYQTYTLGKGRASGSNQGYIENLEVAKRENSVILYEKDYQQHYAGFDPNSPESSILFELIQYKHMENSIALAKDMQRYICAATGRLDKGVHQDNLAVLRLSSMPACLLELGFISTADEEQFLCSDAAVNRFARGFYNAFVAYKKKVAPGTTLRYKPAPEPEPESEGAAEAAGGNGSDGSDGNNGSDGSHGKAAAQEAPSASSASASDAPVFKVQILTSSTKLRQGNSQLKGVKDADFYKEGRIYKYTVGASTNYQEIYQLRKSLLDKFPQAFIIAFRGTEKMDVQAAIREYKSNKKKK